MLSELADALAPTRSGIAMKHTETGAVEVIAALGGPAPGDLLAWTAARFDPGEEGVRGALATVPLPAGGGLWVGFDRPRTLEAEDRVLLEMCAVQAGLALERARLYEQSRDVAHVLQQALVAGAPVSDPRVEIATAYLPAIEHLEVGGDWHDAFALPDGRLGIAVGDVVGRGIGAASAMGQLRSAVRALAAAGLPPARVLGHLDTFVEQLAAARYATLIYAEVDPATGTVCCASAGHLPAILLRGGEAPEMFMAGRSAPLGVPGREPRPQAAFTLAAGDGFLFYTDGLVERRGEAIDDGLERLLTLAAQHADAAPDALVRLLPEAVLDAGAAGDDVCLLALRRVAP